MAVGYSFAYHQRDVPHLLWAFVAWLCVTTLALGRLFGGWQARRAALASGAAFVTVIVLWLAVRVTSSEPGRFL
jgi:ABC-type transport system involved in cytochrome c biogenesis permease subunit